MADIETEILELVIEQLVWVHFGAAILGAIVLYGFARKYFVFSRKEAQITALKCNQLSLLTKEEKARAKTRVLELAELYNISNFTSKELYSLLIKGIGYHHAGMLPALKGPMPYQLPKLADLG